jgi:putative flippase GtrA
MEYTLSMVSPNTAKILRFLISGTAGAVVNIGTLFALVEYLHLYYLTAAILSYLVSIAFGFALQKFWTFRDHGLSGVHFQFARFTVIALINMAANTALMYLFVSVFGVQYLLSQIIVALMIAFASYVNYQKFVFTSSSPPVSDYSRTEVE